MPQEEAVGNQAGFRQAPGGSTPASSHSNAFLSIRPRRPCHGITRPDPTLLISLTQKNQFISSGPFSQHGHWKLPLTSNDRWPGGTLSLAPTTPCPGAVPPVQVQDFTSSNSAAMASAPDRVLTALDAHSTIQTVAVIWLFISGLLNSHQLNFLCSEKECSKQQWVGLAVLPTYLEKPVQEQLTIGAGECNNTSRKGFWKSGLSPFVQGLSFCVPLCWLEKWLTFLLIYCPRMTLSSSLYRLLPERMKGHKGYCPRIPPKGAMLFLQDIQLTSFKPASKLLRSRTVAPVYRVISIGGMKDIHTLSGDLDFM